MMITVTDVGAIVFHRPAGGRRDRLRVYRLVVNGHLVGEIRRGQVVRVPVRPGRHQVQAVIDWTGSPLMLWQMASSGGWLRLTVEGVEARV